MNRFDLKASPLLCLCLLGGIFVSILNGCTSAQYKKQNYGSRQSSKVMEYQGQLVWKGLKKAMERYKLTDIQQPEHPESEEGSLETDWVISTSNDKYIEVTVNQMPRRKYLQTRFRFKVYVSPHMMGQTVSVDANEEIEAVDSLGRFEKWHSVPSEDRDHSRSQELLENIERMIRSI